MTVIVTLCERGGMLFNKRRQSRDKNLIKDLKSVCDDGALFISDFSAMLFNDSEISCIEVSNPLDSAKEGDYAFIENLHLKGYENKIEKMIIYKWNRKYPADFYIDVTPEMLGFDLKETYEFVGNSHEKITREVYAK